MICREPRRATAVLSIGVIFCVLLTQHRVFSLSTLLGMFCWALAVAMLQETHKTSSFSFSPCSFLRHLYLWCSRSSFNDSAPLQANAGSGGRDQPQKARGNEICTHADP